MEKMDNKILIGVLVIVLVVGGFILFGMSSSEPVQDQGIAQANGQADGGDGNVRVINVNGNEFKFNPGQISVKKGERVRIVFTNTGTLPHDFVIEGTQFRTRIIGPGEQDVIEFTASETATYTFYCSVGTHRQNGMEGKMMVVS